MKPSAWIHVLDTILVRAWRRTQQEKNSMIRLKSAAFTWILLCGSLVWAASDSTSPQGMRLYVTNSRGDDVSVIDLRSMKVISTIKVGERVHGVAVQAD